MPPWERPRYQGYFALIFTTSSVGGPLLGGFVVHHYDWRWLFLANLPLGVLAFWRMSRLPRPLPSAARHAPYDPAGFVLFVLCAASALVWFGQVGQRFALVSTVSALFATVAQLWVWPDDLVMDVTYGKGNFWTVFHPERFIRHDLKHRMQDWFFARRTTFEAHLPR